MVSMSKFVGLSRKKPFIIGILFVLIIIVVIFFSISNNNNNKKQKPKLVRHNPTYSYTYASSDYSCKQVKARPDSTETIPYCSGTLKVNEVSTKQIKEFKLTNSTHLYNSTGAEQPLSTIQSLKPKATKIYLTLFAGSKDSLSSIIYKAQ